MAAEATGGTVTKTLWGLPALDDRRERSARVLDESAPKRQGWIDGNHYYYSQVIRLLRFVIPDGQRVLMLRSDTGDLLASVSPSRGVGVEVSPRVLEIARRRRGLGGGEF